MLILKWFLTQLNKFALLNIFFYINIQLNAGGIFTLPNGLEQW